MHKDRYKTANFLFCFMLLILKFFQMYVENSKEADPMWTAKSWCNPEKWTLLLKENCPEGLDIFSYFTLN